MSFKILLTVAEIAVIDPESNANTLVDDGRTSAVFGCGQETFQPIATAFARGPVSKAFERRQRARIKETLLKEGKTPEQIDTALAVVTSDRPFLDWFLSLPWDKIIEALLRIIVANEAVEDISSEA